MEEKDVEKALRSLIFTARAKDGTGASRTLLIWVTINVVATVAIVPRVLVSKYHGQQLFSRLGPFRCTA